MNVIKHMQTFEYIKPIKASTKTNFSQMHRHLEIDLVLYDWKKRKKDHILTSICTEWKNMRVKL